MNKRPQSREETPKEGSDSKRYRTATVCDRTAQNARVFGIFPTQNAPVSHHQKCHQCQALTFFWRGSDRGSRTFGLGSGWIPFRARRSIALPDVEYARVNLSTKRVTTRWRGGDPPPMVETLTVIGYEAHLFDADSDQWRRATPQASPAEIQRPKLEKSGGSVEPAARERCTITVSAQRPYR